MNTLLKSIVASSLAIMSINANAEIVFSDLTSNGDNQAVLDTETGKEWLNLSNTDSVSFGSVLASIDTTYAGWRLPSKAEMITYFEHIVPSANPLVSNNQVSNEDRDRWNTFMGSTGNDFSLGWYLSAPGALHFVGIHQGNKFYSTGYVHNYYNSHVNSGDSNIGVFLVSDGGLTLSSLNNPSINANNPDSPFVQDVSAPISLGALSVVMFGLGLRRKNKVASIAL